MTPLNNSYRNQSDLHQPLWSMAAEESGANRTSNMDYDLNEGQNASGMLPPGGDHETLLNNYRRMIMQTKEYKAMDMLQMYMPPTLLILGTIGNVLVLVVLLQSQLRSQSSACYYMAVLAGVNTLVLHMGCGLQWLSQIAQISQIANLADWLCKVWQFLFTTIHYSSSWLVVLFAIDRFIFLWHPQRAPYFCTVFTAKLLTTGIYIGLGVICIHAMWIYELLPMQGCAIDPHQKDFETVAWPWILATVCSYVPLLLTLVFLILLAVGLCSCTNCSRAANERTADRFTHTALVICIIHFICALPAIIINFVWYMDLEYFHHAHMTAKLYLAQEVAKEANCFSLMLTFLIYLLCVPLLRGEVAGLCMKYILRRDTSSSSSSTCREQGEEIEGNARGKLLLSVSTSGQDSNATQSTFV